MEQSFDLQAGQSIQQRDIGFRAYGLVVENITNQWYYEPSRRRYIPPYQAGVTVPLTGATTATLIAQTPGAIVQAAPISNEYLSASYTDVSVAAGAGINVSGASGPTSVPVTELDLAEGGAPAAPPVALARLWADAQGAIHRLLTTGDDQPLTSVAAFLSSARATSPTTTSTTYVTLDGDGGNNELRADVQTTAAAVLAAVASVTVLNSLGQQVNLALSLDGAAEVGEQEAVIANTGYRQVLTCVYAWSGLSAAVHNVRVRWKVGGATGTANGLQRNLLVLVARR